MLYQYTIGEVKDLEEKADEKYENMDTPSSSENKIEVEVSQQQQDDRKPRQQNPLSFGKIIRIAKKFQKINHVINLYNGYKTIAWNWYWRPVPCFYRCHVQKVCLWKIKSPFVCNLINKNCKC